MVTDLTVALAALVAFKSIKWGSPGQGCFREVTHFFMIHFFEVIE